MLRTKEVGNYIVAYLKGRLDVHISGEIEKDLMVLSEKNPDSDFVLNLEGIEYMSSSGLRVLVALMRHLKSKGRKMKLCNMNVAVKKIFEVVELMDMFDIYPSEEDALK
ncbi:MAG: STAS domain-containing protein [Leptospiraceae bacterium]|nr:STAS domain-containing protein [Leptospiraceae bacterium]